MDKYWPTAKKMLSKAIPYSDGTFDIDAIYRLIKSSEMQLWFVIGAKVMACLATQIINYPKKKVCAISFLAGHDMHEWMHLLKDLEEWARSMQCDAIEGYGRKGFQKIKGWKIVHSVMRKNL